MSTFEAVTKDNEILNLRSRNSELESALQRLIKCWDTGKLTVEGYDMEIEKARGLIVHKSDKERTHVQRRNHPQRQREARA